MMKNKLNIILLILFTSLLGYGQITPNAQSLPPSIFFSQGNLLLDQVTYHIDWNSFIITTEIHVSWTPNSMEQYTYPKESFYMSQDSFPNIFAEMSDEIIVVGKNTLTDFIRDHASYQLIISNVLANTIPVNDIPDKNLSGNTTVFSTSMVEIIQNIIIPTYGTLPVPYIPSAILDNTEYTSIIFATDKPIHIIQNQTNTGFFGPKIMPRVYSYDTTTIVYTPEYLIRAEKIKERPYVYIYEEDYPQANTGGNPKFIIPEFLDDSYAGDLVLNEADTKEILSSSNLRSLIQQGLVFFIIPNTNKWDLR